MGVAPRRIDIITTLISSDFETAMDRAEPVHQVAPARLTLVDMISTIT
jgi:hypothetical protein